MLRALFIDDDAEFLEGLTEVATQEGLPSPARSPWRRLASTSRMSRPTSSWSI